MNNELVFIPVDHSICKYSLESYVSLLEEHVHLEKRNMHARIFQVFKCALTNDVSVLTETVRCPQGYIERSSGWNCLYINATISFSEVGVLAPILDRIKEIGVSILAISSYKTDYVFFPQNDFERVVDCLKNNYAITIESSESFKST